MHKIVVLKIAMFFLVTFIFNSCTNKTLHNTNIQVTTDNKKLNSFLIDAKRAQLFGSTEEFLQQINTIIEIDSNYAVAYFELGKFYLQRKDYPLAVLNSKKAYQLIPSKNEYALLFAQSSDANGDFEIAISMYEKILKQNDNNIELWYDIFGVLDKNEKYKLLDTYLDNFERKFGLNEELVLNRYQNLVNQKRFKNLEKYLLSVIKRNPKMEIATVILGDYYFSLGKFNKSGEVYEKLLVNNKFHEQALIGMVKISLQKGDLVSVIDYSERLINSTSVDVLSKLSIIVELSKSFEKIDGVGANIFDPLIINLYNQYPENPDVRYFHGNVLYRTGKNKEALNDFLYSLKLNPSNLQMWLFSLYILETEKEYDRLISVADSALIYFPNQKDIFILRGFAYLQVKQYRKSLEDFLFAKRLTGVLDEDKVQILHYLAEIYFIMENKNQAFLIYDEILKLNNNDIIALNNYAYYLALDNMDLNKALDMSQRSVKLEPKNSTYLDTYAYILFKLKKYSDALFYIEKAILNGGTNSAVILGHYGDILFMNGQKELAISTWKEAKNKGLESDSINKKIETGEYFEQ
ncbi:MAG: hypothetical protein RBR35_02060 [Salinivirgaceae bacterium]|nr:hypothetical protein [Salinivirgaceae bacterium]